MMMKNMNLMETMKSLMTGMEVDQVQVEGKFQRSLLKPLRVSSMTIRIQKR